MIDRLAAAALTLLTIALLALLPAWRMAEPKPAYMMPPELFRARVQAFAHDKDVVEPMPGDVFLLAEPFRFWPELKLQPGQTYRLHIASVDGVHAVAINGTEILLAPGDVWVAEINGPQDLRCNEYCGLGHNKMRVSPASGPPAAR